MPMQLLHQHTGQVKYMHERLAQWCVLVLSNHSAAAVEIAPEIDIISLLCNLLGQKPDMASHTTPTPPITQLYPALPCTQSCTWCLVS